jgi:hypothetical protein
MVVVDYHHVGRGGYHPIDILAETTYGQARNVAIA